MKWPMGSLGADSGFSEDSKVIPTLDGRTPKAKEQEGRENGGSDEEPRLQPSRDREGQTDRETRIQKGREIVTHAQRRNGFLDGNTSQRPLPSLT